MEPISPSVLGPEDPEPPSSRKLGVTPVPKMPLLRFSERTPLFFRRWGINHPEVPPRPRLKSPHGNPPRLLARRFHVCPAALSQSTWPPRTKKQKTAASKSGGCLFPPPRRKKGVCVVKFPSPGFFFFWGRWGPTCENKCPAKNGKNPLPPVPIHFSRPRPPKNSDFFPFAPVGFGCTQKPGDDLRVFLFFFLFSEKIQEFFFFFRPQMSFGFLEKGQWFPPVVSMAKKCQITELVLAKAGVTKC